MPAKTFVLGGIHCGEPWGRLYEGKMFSLSLGGGSSKAW